MTQEEAMKILKDFHDKSALFSVRTALDTLIPELKESEDEKIRKALLEMIHDTTGDSLWVDYNVHKEDALDWLEKHNKPQIRTGIEWVNIIDAACDKRYSEEYAHGEYCHEQSFKWGFQEGVDWLKKQGKQRSDSKVEPKFKVGDWIINNDKRIADSTQILKIEKYGYITSSGYTSFDKVKTDYHFWTIQDAKDGDVLVCESGWTCIFKTLVNDETFSSYCFMDATKWFCETGSECHTLKEEFVKAYNGKIYPATKEQHDFLFQKMKEAGYEWDAEKKKLKKTEQKSAKINMTNEEKAKKIVDNIFSTGLNTYKTFYEMAYNSAMQMAEWKDKV